MKCRSPRPQRNSAALIKRFEPEPWVSCLLFIKHLPSSCQRKVSGSAGGGVGGELGGDPARWEPCSAATRDQGWPEPPEPPPRLVPPRWWGPAGVTAGGFAAGWRSRELAPSSVTSACGGDAGLAFLPQADAGEKSELSPKIYERKSPFPPGSERDGWLLGYEMHPGNRGAGRAPWSGEPQRCRPRGRQRLLLGSAGEGRCDLVACPLPSQGSSCSRVMASRLGKPPRSSGFRCLAVPHPVTEQQGHLCRARVRTPFLQQAGCCV